MVMLLNLLAGLCFLFGGLDDGTTFGLGMYEHVPVPITSVVDPKLFFSDPDPLFRRALDPDPT
jgi:hypothetical protein